VALSKEQLLAEIEDVIRTMPPSPTFEKAPPSEYWVWLGRTRAAIENWNPSKSAHAADCVQRCTVENPYSVRGGMRDLTILLHQARHDILLQIPAAGSLAVAHGMVFDYFDDIRKKIELAKQDVFFVDPYLEADFVSRYLPHVAAGVTIRLLAREKLASLLPAVDAFSKQSGSKIEVRSAANFHDRYLFVDSTSCYHSGASFKDGAKSAPTVITQIIDAFRTMATEYEDRWLKAKVER
jgi:hypothetical protein